MMRMTTTTKTTQTTTNTTTKTSTKMKTNTTKKTTTKTTTIMTTKTIFFVLVLLSAHFERLSGFPYANLVLFFIKHCLFTKRAFIYPILSCNKVYPKVLSM